MAKLTIGQKAERVLELLMGLRHPRVASTLAAYGFTEADLNDGWNRLRAVSGKRLAVKTQSVADPRLIEQLDAFENRWFPIASATLRRHHPEVADWLFLNLSQTEGLEVIVSVSTFLERLRALPEQPVPGAAAARELLAARGLNAATLTEVEDLLKKLPTVREPPSPIGPTLEEQTVAENAMWDWYLEWAQIARATLHDRRLLRQLGFLKRRGGAEVSEPLDEVSGTAEDEDEDQVALAAAS